MGDEYRVNLEAFEGPLDLLLYLIRRHEVEIADIPIARLTDQYLAHLSGLERIDIETAGEFLLMAATLMEIKSRMLAPGAPEGADGAAPDPADDPRAELVRQLLAYKRLRDASDRLEERFRQWQRRVPAGRAAFDAGASASVPDDDEALELEDLSLADLAQAFQRISESINFDRLGDHAVVYDDTPLEIHAADLLDLLARAPTAAPGDAPDAPGLPLRAVFEGRSRAEMLGLFLAMLELVRQRRIAVRQDRGTGEITVRLREQDPADAAPPEVFTAETSRTPQPGPSPR